MKYICLSDVPYESTEFCGSIDRGKSAEPMPFDCERIVYRGVGRLITMEK